MYRNVKFVAAMLLGGLAAPSLAMAQTAIVTTDLNLRIGPGSGYQVITAMPAGHAILVGECLDGLGWCQVSFGGYTGWAYSAYLAFGTGGEQVVIAEPARPVGVAVAVIAPPHRFLHMCAKPHSSLG